MTDKNPPPPPDDARARLEALRRATELAESPPSSPSSATSAAPSAAPSPSASAAQAEGPQASGATSLSLHAPSAGHKIWMAIGLIWMTGLGTLPLLFLLWFLGSLLGVVFIAEALERTRGLVPTTYGGAFWLAVALIVLLIVLEIATWIPRGDPKQARGGCLMALLTRPAFAAVLLFLPTILLVRWDLGGTDVPDILTTTALLFILGYGLFVLPIAFVASSIRLARWLWRIGKSSSFRSGLVAGVTSALGALSTCMLCTPPDPDDEAEGELFGERLEHGAQALGTSIERKGLVDGTLGALTQAADVIPGSSGPWALPPALLPSFRASIDECVTRLATSARGRATVDKATDWLIRNKSTDRDTANSVAYATIWSVCRVHAREALDDLEIYYWKAVKQNYCKSYQRNPLRECPVYDDGNYQCNAGFPFGSHARLDVVLDMRGKLCRLGSKDREIILRTLDGETSKEIARALDLTDANVRQRLRRALERISDG